MSDAPTRPLYCNGSISVWDGPGMIYWYSLKPMPRRAFKEPTPEEDRLQFDVRTSPGFDLHVDEAFFENRAQWSPWYAYQLKQREYHRRVIKKAIGQGHPLVGAR